MDVVAKTDQTRKIQSFCWWQQLDYSGAVCDFHRTHGFGAEGKKATSCPLL